MVRFKPRARLDRSRMRDAGRGRAGAGGGLGGSGMRLPLPSGVGGGGCGGLLLVVVVVVVLLLANNCLGANIPVVPGGDSGSDSSPGGDDGDLYDRCQTGEDANRSRECARVAIENSLTDYWADELGGDFRPIERLTTFTDAVSTGCGPADSSVGPFYCPADEQIYLDTRFFDQVLEAQLGGPDGDFVEFYVLAHEYGHHVSNLLGFMGRVRTQQGPQSDATRLELQADCYAGMWAHHATEGEQIEQITEEDVTEALEAARTVGDDYIQRKTQGQVTPETWNHGSSEQRMHWFTVGYEQGDLEACDTFAADQV